MGCSCWGLLSLLTTGLAVVLSSVALGLPLWSANNSQFTTADPDNTFTTTVETADRGYGVWGVCSDITLSNEEGSADNCYPYFSNKKVATFVKENTDNNDALDTVDLDTSLCKIFNKFEDKLAELPVDVLTTNDINFLERMCARQGKATLAFAVLAPSLSFIAFVLLVLSITCCDKNGCFVKLGLLLLNLSILFSVLAIAFWVYVSSPLRETNDDDEESGNSFAASFGLSIAGLIVTAVATFFVGCHIKKGNKEEMQRV